MHDIRFIRENFEVWQKAMDRRPLSAEQRDQIASILDLDVKARAAQTTRQDAEAGRNAASKAIGAAKAQKDEAKAAELMAQVAAFKVTMDGASVDEEKAAAALRDILAGLPNTPAEDVPVGADEGANKPERDWNPSSKTRGQLLNQPRDHVAIGEAMGLMDFEAAARMSGARFVALKGQLARLERALAAFMVDLQTETHGYQEVSPPYIVNDKAAFGTGQLPKFTDDLFATVQKRDLRDRSLEALQKATQRPDLIWIPADPPQGMNAAPGITASAFVTDDASLRRIHAEEFAKVSEDSTGWLIPTAEVSLTNLYRETILAESDLATPIRMTADTPCFRSEAGSAGRDTRGMIRMHQFRKVELVSICKPEDSAAEHDRMVGCAEEVLKRLGLPFRTMLLCSGDMGFTAKKTYDLEVWLPSQNKYREISSCSNCGDFQARRMDARFRREGQKGTEFVHTLNGSGLAVGRTLVAVLENYQNADGTVTLPDVLVPYMGGKTQIG